MEKVEIEKDFYPSGELSNERTMKDGIPHGRHRQWHKNGTLASEIYYKDCVPDGVGRQWDEEGNLVAEFEIINGTGVEKRWMSEAGLWGEISYINGRWTGRQRVYCIEDGEVVGDTYWINNKEVSKNYYQEQCKIDSELPRYGNR